MEGPEGIEIDLNQITYTCYSYTNQSRKWLNKPDEEPGTKAIIIVLATESESTKQAKIYIRTRTDQKGSLTQTWST